MLPAIMLRLAPVPSAPCCQILSSHTTTLSISRLRARQQHLMASSQLRTCVGVTRSSRRGGSWARDLSHQYPGGRTISGQRAKPQSQSPTQSALSQAYTFLPCAQIKYFVASGRLCASKNDKGQPNPPQDKSASSRLRKVLPSLARSVTKRENINTIPNWLTASRLIAAPFVGYCILHDHHSWALGLFAYAGITDLLDGWIARKWNLQTVVGTVIDPMADKTLMTVLTVALATKGLLPIWLAVIILGRDVALAISAIYYRWISLPPPKTFARYWDFSLPSAEVRPTAISKYNTALQLGLMGMTTLAPVIPAVDLAGPLVALQYVVATTTIWSGASYVYSKDAVKILPHTPEPSSSSDNKATPEGEKTGDQGKSK